MYIPLRVHSPHSISEGAARPAQLAAFALEHNMPALGVADTKSLGGTYAQKDALKKKGIQPLHGVILPISHPGLEGETEESILVLYAQTKTGYEQICTLLSQALTQNGTVDLKSFMLHKDIGEYLVLTGGKKGPIDKAILANNIGKAKQRLTSLKNLFGDRLWVEIQRQTKNDIPHTQILAEMAEELSIPSVATQESWYIDPAFKTAHDALLCISQGVTLDHHNRTHTDPAGHIFTPEEMKNLFSDLPETLDATLHFAQSCRWFIQEETPVLPAFPGLTETETEALRQQAKTGLEKRLEIVEFVEGKTAFGYTRKDYEDRLDYELSVIENMGFPGYFLIVSDFIKWSKENDIPVGPGRGSGAGSIVAWALLITDLDPLRYGLFFERFLNPERVSMPDFDIDFCQERRDEVINYVRDHYGQDRVAQIGTLGKLQARAVIRAAGRVLQIPYMVVDRYVKLIPNDPAHPVPLKDAMEADPLKTVIAESDDTIKQMFKIGVALEGLYAHASTHAAGVVIGNKPVGEIVPVYKDDNGTTVTGYDMKGVEKAGLVKFDFLGLKTLDIIKGAMEMISAQGHTIDFEKMGTEDAATYDMLRKGESFGVFQLESSGMRKAMLQIQPTCIEDIIALVALYRPGPMENIPVYADIKAGREDPDYLHPLMKDTLNETHGIIVYQEQVMKLAQDMAGYSLGGADLLRRAMGKKIKAEMDAQEAVFIDGAKEQGIDPDVAKQTFDLIAKFANYGFNKSHAAAYAVIAYQTAYLRCHHKEAFLASTMNLDLNDVEKIAEALEDARRFNIAHKGPDINISQAKFSVMQEKNLVILHGLAALRGVGLSMAKALVEEREKNGPFVSLHDLTRRCAGTINKKALESLVASGACDSFSINRASIWTAIPDALKEATREKTDKERGQGSLFDVFGAAETMETPLPDVPAWTNDETLTRQYDVVGFFLDGHPLDRYRSTLSRRNNTRTIRDLLTADENTFMPREIIMGAYVLDSTFRKTRKDKPMLILRICDETGMMEALAFEETVTHIQDKLPKPTGSKVVLTVNPAGDAEDLSLFIRDIELLDIPAT